jgi:TolA-binding protein
MYRFILSLLLIILFATAGCEQQTTDQAPGKVTVDDVRRDAGKALNTAAEFSQQAKVELQQKLAARLKDLDAEIAKLRDKGRDLKDQAKADWDVKLADLEAKRAAASAKLAELGNSSAEAWKDIQQGTQSAWDELEKSFQEAAREFK